MHEFFYIISTESEENTLNDIGSINRHLPLSDSTWDMFTHEDIARLNHAEWGAKWDVD